MLHLERTLGIRMERMQADGTGIPENKGRAKLETPRFNGTPVSGMVRLPGEVLQSHLEN